MKRYMSYLVAAFLPMLIGVVTFMFTFNLVYSGFAFVLTGLLVIFLAKKMSTTAFSMLEENPNPFILNISSTGIWKIIPATVDANQRLHFKLGKHDKSHIYNRDLAHNLTLENKSYTKKQEGQETILTIKNDELLKGMYKVSNKPFFVYDSISNMMLSKGALSDFETKLTTRHAIANLLAHQEQLILSLKPFSRHVMDLLQGGSASKFIRNWGWILLLIVAGIIGALFLPNIIRTFQTTVQAAVPPAAHVVNSTVPKVI